MGVRGKRTKPTKRMVRAEVRWRGILADHRASGRSVGDFCRERGLSKEMLFKWRKRLRVADEARAASQASPAAGPAATGATLAAAKLVPVRVTSGTSAANPGWAIEISFPAGHMLRFGHGIGADVITAVLATMRAVAC